ncbi:MAG: ribulose-phosphate 3-epimerase [Candidatus Krumholzibacteriia bacterium]
MSWWLRHPDAAVAVAPSLLSADFAELRGEVASMEQAGVDLLHLDVMDAHFVPNLTFGPFICAAVRRCTDLVLDAHLMMTDPHRYLEPFAEAGVDALTIHVEAASPVAETLERIGGLGLRRGLTLNPGTPLAAIEPYLDQVDLVLVMTVQPGFGGQSFDPSGIAKIARLAALRDQAGHAYAISVDGGINDETAAACRQAGADILVSGSWFCRAADRGAAAARLRGR